MKKKWLGKSAFWGVIIIILAVLLILSNMGLLIANTYSILMGLVMLAIAVAGFIKLNFSTALLGVAHLVYLFREFLHIPNTLSGWLLILAGTLIGVGLDLIFKNVKNKNGNGVTPPFTNGPVNPQDSNHAGASGFQTGAGGNINIKNSFGDRTNYIDSNNFTFASLENSFGQFTGYFDNVVMGNAEATVKAENAFGNMNLYIPHTWRVDLHEDSGFGKVIMNGVPSREPDAPLLHLYIDNGFGTTQIYYV